MSGQGPAVWESYKTISLAVQKHPYSNKTDNMSCEYKERLQVLLTTVSRTVSASSKATFTIQALMFRFFLFTHIQYSAMFARIHQGKKENR